VPQHLSVDIDLLRPNPWNTNIVTPENEDKIANSLDELPFFKPIVVRETGETDTPYEILGGEHRWDQAKNKGWTKIDVWNIGTVSDDIAKKIMLADNARYGADDTIELAKLLEELGGDEVQAILPYSDADIRSIFSSVDIALDDLDIDENYTKTDEKPEPPQATAPKTHTIQRYKVGLTDAESITALIAKTQKKHGFTSGDELTNAGDALVFLLLGGKTEDEETE
jgi:ParB-like chromosome segregation protein Spo0J